MTRTLTRGGVVALALFLVALLGDAIGLESLWPVILAAAVGLVAGHDQLGRFGAFLAGVAVGWFAFAIRAGFLPDVASARALVVAFAVVAITAVAAGTGERLPLWAGLAGAAAFLGLYEPIYADTPTTFLADSPVAVVSVVLSAAIAAIAVTIADVLAPADADIPTIVIPDSAATPRTVTITETQEEVR